MVIPLLRRHVTTAMATVVSMEQREIPLLRARDLRRFCAMQTSSVIVSTSTVEGSGWKDFWQHHGSRKRRAGDAHQHGNHGVHVAVGAVHSQQWRHVHSCKSAQPSNFSTRFEALLLAERLRGRDIEDEKITASRSRELAFR